MRFATTLTCMRELDSDPAPQIKQIENKKLREFYEKQNDRLNDWLEVDTVVRAIADDIFDSFDPDRDHDGIPGSY